MLGWVTSPNRDAAGARVGALRLQVRWEPKSGGYASYVFGHRLRHVFVELEEAQAYVLGVAGTELERARTDLLELQQAQPKRAQKTVGDD